MDNLKQPSQNNSKVPSPTQEVGIVTSVRNFLLHVNGLPTVKINDMVETENGSRGWVNALQSDSVEVLLLDEASIQPGQLFKKSGKKLTIEVGDFLLGRAINPLGVPLDGKGSLTKTRDSITSDLESTPLGIEKRKFIIDQFDTQITMIDTLVPIGRGQRELVMGDARSGKNSFLIDILVNQKNTGVICIFALIGKPINEVRSTIDILKTNQALDYTVVVATSSTDMVPLIFLTPHAAFTIAEYFQKEGKDVLVILDDLGNHAKIYRELSLLGNKSPGRESYPGDMFYQHAYLLERAGSFNPSVGGGSITALPVIELNLNDFTGLIPTNLMAMTDGHLLFRSSIFNLGQLPSIDLPLSVSRVGKQTQKRLQNNLSYKIKQLLTQAESLETVKHFSTELSNESQLLLRQKEQILELLNQENLTAIPKEVQTILLSLVLTPFFQYKSVKFVQKNKKTLAIAFTQDSKLVPLTESVFELNNLDELLNKLKPLIPHLENICQP